MKHFIFYIFVYFCVSACGQTKDPGEFITVEKGVEISIKPCVEANSRIFGNSIDPVAFCKCLIPKFYADTKDDPENQRHIKEGNWDKLSEDKREFMIKYYQECMAQTTTNDSMAKLTITPGMAEGMKKTMKQELSGSDVERTNDVDKYCDCILNHLQTAFTAQELIQTNFSETEKYQEILDSCYLSTKKINRR